MFIVGRVTAPIDADTNPFLRGLNTAFSAGANFSNKISGQLKNVGSSITSFGQSLTKFITVPLAAGVLAAAKFGKDFEAEMSKVVGLVGVSQNQVNSWKKDILSLSPEIAKPPQELAEAMFFVTSAGLRGAAALDVLKMSGKASAAGLGETKTIADLVTSAINAYGAENLTAAQATDIMVAAVREGKAEASELAATMGAVLPLASELGVTFDQVAATQAAMTKTGTDAAEAATQLKSIMAGLIKPSKQAEETLNAMGTSSSEMRKKIKDEGLLQALMDLREMTNKYGEEAMARVFPNIRALMGVLDLMGNNLESNKKTFDAVKNSTGSLDKAFKAASETLDFKWNAALSAIQATLIKFFDVIKGVALPILEGLVKGLDFVGNAFQSLTPFQQKLTLAFAAMAAIIGPVIVGIGTSIGILGGIIGGVSTVLTVLGTIFSGISIPILAAIGGIVALGTSFIGLILSSEKVRNAIKEKFDGIVSKIKEAAKFIEAHSTDIKKSIKGLIEGIATGNFGNFINAMKNIVPSETMAKIHNVIMKFVEFRDKIIGIRDKIIEFGSRVISALEPIKNVLATAFKHFKIEPIITAFNNMKTSIQPLLPVLKMIAQVIGIALATSIGIAIAGFSGFIAAIDNIVAMIMNAVGIIINIVTILVGAIIGLFTGNWDLLIESSRNLWENIKGLFMNAGLAIIGFIGGFVDGIIGFFKFLYKTIVGGSIIPDLVKGIIKWIKSLPGKVFGLVSGFITGIINYFMKLLNKAISIWNNIKAKIINYITTLIISAISHFSKLYSKAISIWNNIKSKVISIASSLISSARSRFNSMSSSLSSIMNSIKSKISSAWNTVKSKAVSAISSMVTTVKDKISGLASSAFKSGKSIVNGIKDGINAAASDAVSAMINLVKKIRDKLPFSPAKEGPLKDLDKLNFAGPIKKSLEKADLLISKDFLGNLLLNNEPIIASNLNNGNNGTVFNGDFNFNGIQDIADFMREMKDFMRRQGGKF